jgi:uncharacterized protein (TIGR03118 family)
MTRTLRCAPASGFAWLLAGMALPTPGCTSPNGIPSTTFSNSGLVSDDASVPAARRDALLHNAWGIAMDGEGRFWVASNHDGVAVVYDAAGNPVMDPVVVPAADGTSPGSPTGVIVNTSTAFLAGPGGPPAELLFAGEDGSVAAWASGTAASIVADRSAAGAVYKGLALAADGGVDYLYLTDFKGRKIDVLASDYTPITGRPFLDPTLPAAYGPFGIQNVAGLLYVTYAKRLAPDFEDDEPGPGHGYVDIFRPDGSLVRRLATQGALDSPWAVTRAPAEFGADSKAILVGNFGDGRVLAYDDTGRNLGPLRDDNGDAITIAGLWAVVVPGTGPRNRVYVAAGPAGETHGLFGTIDRN